MQTERVDLKAGKSVHGGIYFNFVKTVVLRV